jgi:hypothetical protein
MCRGGWRLPDSHTRPHVGAKEGFWPQVQSRSSPHQQQQQGGVGASLVQPRVGTQQGRRPAGRIQQDWGMACSSPPHFLCVSAGPCPSRVSGAGCPTGGDDDGTPELGHFPHCAALEAGGLGGVLGMDVGRCLLGSFFLPASLLWPPAGCGGREGCGQLEVCPMPLPLHLTPLPLRPSLSMDGLRSPLALMPPPPALSGASKLPPPPTSPTPHFCPSLAHTTLIRRRVSKRPSSSSQEPRIASPKVRRLAGRPQHI